jgi:uncharacterized protein YjbI with pentapeptide repeats
MRGSMRALRRATAAGLGTNCPASELVGANLPGANLTGADLRMTSLRRAIGAAGKQ